MSYVAHNAGCSDFYRGFMIHGLADQLANELTDCLTNQPTVWSRVLPSKFTGPQLVKK